MGPRARTIQGRVREADPFAYATFLSKMESWFRTGTMCSVCGIASEEPDPSNIHLVLGMLHATRHRGPDACGVFTCDGASGSPAREVHLAATPAALAEAIPARGLATRVALAQSRLTITGSADAHQPLVSRDGRLALAHNGEVYNHAVLADILGESRDSLTGSDSEVVMRVLEHHHRATSGNLAESVRRTVGMLSGMYALAVTDGEMVVLARDAIGKKPLYYVDGDERFGWASERKALVELAVDQTARIERLEPGAVLVHERGGRTDISRVETLAAPAIDITDPEVALETYRTALDAAIARRTRGLDRCAVFFSGGVDSVVVARLLQLRGIDVTGYVVGAAGSSDVKYATEVAAEMDLPVRVTTVDEDVVETELPRIIKATELHGPMMTEVSVPMWFAAKAAHEDGHRVVFTGQAADELFAGYPWYRGVLESDGPLTLHARLWEDIRALPLDTLEREDRISMAWSLEMRAPFLDAEVIRVAMRIDPTVKLNDADDSMGKRPHRRLAEAVGVPRSVSWRTKVPAQDGASIHELLERMAERRFPSRVPDSDVPDFGSNYRYRDQPGMYGTPKVRALLDEVVRDGGILVADGDGTAQPPSRRVVVRDVRRATTAPAVR